MFQLLTNVWLPRVFSGDGYRGSMVKVPVKCAKIFVFFSPAFSPFRVANPSLARCLFLQRVRHKFPCVVFGENEDRPGNSVKQKKKKKKIPI
jgi:hypothetical protein